MLKRCIGAGRHGGAVTLAMITAMLASITAMAMAVLSLLLVGRQTILLRLEREIAFRSAEMALADAEADLLAALRDPAPVRLAPLPRAGHCGAGVQQGICVPDAVADPPWQTWLRPGMAVAPDPGVAFGAMTAAHMPDIPADLAGGNVPPRYLIEALPASGAARPLFRITALGHGRDAAVRVVLQTFWTPPVTGQRGGMRAGRLSWRELVPER